MAQCACGGRCGESSHRDSPSTKNKVRGQLGASPGERKELGLRASTRKRNRDIVAEESKYAKVRQEKNRQNPPTY